MQSAWSDFDLDIKTLPSKSSLSEARAEISYKLFKDSFESQIIKVSEKLKKFKGYKIFAVDGDQLELPATEDILAHEYRGYPCKDNKETHFPRMYYTSKVEVFSGIVVDVNYSEKNEECKMAREMAEKAEENTVSIYDRLHFSMDLARSHECSKSYYIARLKTGEKVLKELQEFIHKKRKAKRLMIDEVKVRFLKVKNPKTNEEMYLATNLPKKAFKAYELQWLYGRRYDIETVFRDLTSTHSLGVWHSTKMNGILQEFYLQFYIHNGVRSLILEAGGVDIPENAKTGTYRRPNFKLIRAYFIKNIKLLIKKCFKKLREEIQFLIQKSLETRVYFSRQSPRVVKSTRNIHPSASLVTRRN